MDDNPAPQPSLDNVRDVLHLSFLLATDSSTLDGLLATLDPACGADPCAAPEWAAANRFVRDVLLAARADRAEQAIAWGAEPEALPRH